MKFDFVEENGDLANIKVVGIGGAGGNAVNRMIEAGLGGVEFLAINTDAQALRESHAHQSLQIGSQLTRGLGSGGDPRIGRKAVEEDEDTLTDVLRGSDMVFVTGGMGGGTGTGAGPVVANIARELGALTVGIITKPFLFEGAVRMRQAEEGIAELKQAVDTLIIIPNERLLEVVPPSTSFREAFRIADNVLYEATRGIYEIISRPNHVNLDFADVRAVMKDMGVALMGTGRAEGEDRAVVAAQAAISSPLLEDIDIYGAQGVLVNLLGAEIGIAEISAAMSHIQDAAGGQAHIIFGYGTDETLGDTMQVTVIATGFNGQSRTETLMADVPEFRPRQDFAPSGEPRPARRRAEPEYVTETEPEPELNPEPVPEPVPTAIPVRQRKVYEQPAAQVVNGAPEPESYEDDPSLSPDLRPVPVSEVPATRQAMGGHQAAPGRPRERFLSDAFMEDLNEPAYTRKYMD